MSASKLSIGVLASGSGTNLQALLDACAKNEIAACVKLVICNNRGAGAVERSALAGVPCVVIPHREYATRADFEAELHRHLMAHSVEFVVMAGFMRVLTGFFVRRWSGRLINVHPSLLPAFPGTHAIRDALEHGVKWAGCTVHFVDEGVDTGPIISQAVVPVHDDDTESSLHSRVQVEEHRLLVESVGLVADRALKFVGRRVSRTL